MIIDWWGGPQTGMGKRFNSLFIREPNCILQPARICNKEPCQMSSCRSLIIGTWLQFCVLFIYVSVRITRTIILSFVLHYKLIGLVLQVGEILLWGMFLGAFTKVRKTIASSVMSVRMEQLGSHWADFHEIW